MLEQISGLSGAEFVLLTPEGRLQESTLPMERPWLEDLARIAQSHRTDENVEHTAVSLGDRDYLVDFVSVSSRPHSTEPATLFILYPEDQLASRIRQAVYPALIAGLDRGGHRRGDGDVACPAIRAADSHARGADGHDRPRRLHADAGCAVATTSCATWPNRSIA